MARVFQRGDILEQRRRWRGQGKTVVFTNGCYDLLHPGHVRLLEQARSLGDVLVLGLNSDAGVRRAKGPSRPLLDERERAEIASALEAVDAVTFFDEDTPRELIALLLPDILVKGADWSHFVAGKEEVEAAGGEDVYKRQKQPRRIGQSCGLILADASSRCDRQALAGSVMISNSCATCRYCWFCCPRRRCTPKTGRRRDR